MDKVFLVMQADPYDEHDSPYPVSAWPDEQLAEQDCKERYDRVFGKGAHERDTDPWSHKPRLHQYFYVEEVDYFG